MNPLNKMKTRKRWISWSIALFLSLSGAAKESGVSEGPSTEALASALSTNKENPPATEPETQTREPEPEIPPDDPGQAVPPLENYFSAIEESVSRIPRETFDPEAVVQKIGQDPIRLFEWVRDETGFVAYAGSLRGPVGVLMDRLGNSLDRALLLHQLLLLGGYKARLATAPLSPDKAKEVLRKSGGRSLARLYPPGAGPSPQEQRGALEEMALKHQLQRSDLLRLFDQAQKDRENEAREISAQVKEQASGLLDIMKDSRRDRPKNPATPGVEAVEKHWWVQWEKDGDWQDLDPTLPGMRPGETIVEPEETFDPEDLEEELHHSITVRAIAEQWTEGRLKENTILEHLLIPSRLMGHPIVLRQLPISWPTDKKLFAAPKPMESFQSTVLGQTQWKAALEIDGKAVVESYFTARGEVTDEPEGGSGKRKETGGAAGAFGALAGGAGKKERASSAGESQLTAEWLEYEIHSPGRPVQIVRREIFDLLGPSLRKKGVPPVLKLTKVQLAERNFKVLGQTELLPLVCRLSPAQIETVAAEYMLLDREFYINLQEEHRSRTPQDVLAQLSELRFPRGELYGLALKRFEFSAEARETYLASPNLFAFHSSVGEDGQGGIIASECLDIIVNDLSVGPAAKEDPFELRLRQGVLETVLEARAMSDTGTVVNTALLFSESKAQNIAWLLIQNEEDPGWKTLDLPPDVRTRIGEDLSAGYWAIAPSRPVLMRGKPESGWWRLSPKTGNILGVGEKGQGQAMTEYATKVNIVLQLKTAIQIYADIMRCLGAALSAPLRGNRPQHDELVIQCIWDTVCKNAHKAAKQLLTIEVNWTNIIISQTISWAMNKLCAALWEKGINR